MKKKVFTACLVLTLLIASGEGFGGVVGGYVDTGEGMFVLATDGGITRGAILATQPSPINIGMRGYVRSGRLFVVSYTGSISIASTSYTDSYGYKVSLPSGSLDKVIFLDKYRRIIGGIGLTEAEAKAIAYGFGEKDILSAIQVAWPSYLPTTIEAIRVAAANTAIASRMSEDERRNLFLTSVRGMGGDALARIAASILSSAISNEEFPLNVVKDVFGYAPEDTSLPLIRGVGVVSNGDNGGGVDECVSEGGSGGEVDDCNLDALMKGASLISLSSPDIATLSLNATCPGTFLMFRSIR